MYRFVAFAWDPADARQETEAEQLANRLLADNLPWKSIYNCPGFRVFSAGTLHSTYRAYVLDGGAGIVLGKIFCWGSSDRRLDAEPSLGEEETRAIVRTKGRFMIDRYWGHYVLLLHDRRGNTLRVLRDPTGGLPCYVVARQSLSLFLSNIDDWSVLQLGKLSINWSHVADFFVHNRLILESTGLLEVSLPIPGQCLTMTVGDQRDTRSPEIYWDPAKVSDTHVIDTPAQARALLRDVVSHCIASWGSCYQTIVHELSGGLDSSIVAAVLSRRTQPAVACFHFFTDIPESDERAYARIAASRCSYELIESEVLVGERPLEQQLGDTRLASPALFGFVPESERAKRELVESREAGAVFTGQGGDHLFQHGKNDLLAAESLQRDGIGSKFFRVVSDTSRMSDQSIWSVLVSTWWHGVLRLRFDPYASFHAPRFLMRNARRPGDPGYAHPWIAAARGLPASKVKLISALIDTQLFCLRPYYFADRIHPLISQPVVECCLRIPSYVMASGGVSRGLVREAFQDVLPDEIATRTSKGTTTSYFNNLLLHNLAAVRELLLEGHLVQERVLDRAMLERELLRGRLIEGREIRSLLNAVRAEAWLRTWDD